MAPDGSRLALGLDNGWICSLTPAKRAFRRDSRAHRIPFDARSGMLNDCLPHLFGNPQAGKLTPNRSADIVLDEVRQLNRSEIVASFPRQRVQRAQHSTVQPFLRLGAHPDGTGAVRG